MDGNGVKGPAPRLPNAELLDGVVRELQEIERRNGIERTLAIGELIITRFFNGDPHAWRDRRRNKNNSVRRLADRKDCPFCKSALNEAIAVYVASLDLPCVRTFGHVGASHVAAVLGLPEWQREEILSQVERGRLSVRELRKHVVSIRRADGERRGRPSNGELSRAFMLLRSGLAQVREGTSLFQDGVPLDPATCERLAALAREATLAAASLSEAAETGGPALSRCPPRLTPPHQLKA